MKNVFLIFSIIYAANAWAQWTHGPAAEVSVVFEECLTINSSRWAFKSASLNCSKVTFAKDSDIWTLRYEKGVTRGKRMNVDNLFVAPGSWNPGAKKIVDFSSLRNFCSSMSANCLDFFYGAIENTEILENYVPFTTGQVETPSAELAAILHYAYYDETAIVGKTDEQIFDMKISGKLYLLPQIYNPNQPYSLDENEIYALSINEFGKNAHVYAYDKQRVEFNPLLNLLKNGKEVIQLAQGVVALTGLVRNIDLSYQEIPVYTQAPEGMYGSWKDIFRKRKKVTGPENKPDLEHELEFEFEDEDEDDFIEELYKPVLDHQEHVLEIIEEIEEIEKSKLEKAIDGENEDWLGEKIEECKNSGPEDYFCKLIEDIAAGKLSDFHVIFTGNNLKKFFGDEFKEVRFISFKLKTGKVITYVFTNDIGLDSHSDLFAKIKKTSGELLNGSNFWGAGYIQQWPSYFEASDCPTRVELFTKFDSYTLEQILGRDRPKELSERKEFINLMNEQLNKIPRDIPRD